MALLLGKEGHCSCVNLRACSRTVISSLSDMKSSVAARAEPLRCMLGLPSLGLEREYTAQYFWICAHVLQTLLATAPHAMPFSVKEQTILELGAGTGRLAISLAKDGGAAKVFATDLPGNIPAISQAVRKASVTRKVEARALTWGDTLAAQELGNIDAVVATDVLYIDDTFGALVSTLETVCRQKPPGCCPVLLIYKERFPGLGTPFLSMAMAAGFQVTTMSLVDLLKRPVNIDDYDPAVLSGDGIDGIRCLLLVWTGA